MVERVDELNEPPVVGRFYWVPTVRWTLGARLRDWPVRGERHEDARDLEFPWLHWHIDWRFVAPRDWRALVAFYSDRHPPEVLAAAKVLCTRDGPAPPEIAVWRRRICRRAEPDWPKAWVERIEGRPGRVRKFTALHARYEGARCKRDARGALICPHRGYGLGSHAPDAQGRIVCPLHGLAIDAATGVVVRHDGAGA